MEVKHKNLHLCLGTCKKVADLGVCMTIPFKDCAPCCLKKLMYNQPASKPELMTGSEEASLAFALFECIRDKLIGSPLETLRSKVSNAKCKTMNGNFLVYWNCQGTGSSLRKTLSLVISCLDVSKLYSKYKENMKFLGGSAPKEHFAYVAKKFIDGIKKSVHFTAVGRINTDKTKLNKILLTAGKKMPKISSVGPTKSPPKRECKTKMHPTVKCSNGLACLVVADYISSNSGGMGVEVHSGVVEVYNDHWETKRKQIKNAKRIQDHVSRKYSKLGDHLGVLLAYFAISRCYADSNTIARLIKQKITLKDLKSLIQKNL